MVFKTTESIKFIFDIVLTEIQKCDGRDNREIENFMNHFLGFEGSGI